MSRYIDADALTSKVRHFFFELIDKVEPIMTEDGGAFDLKIVNPLLEANKAIASIIREQPSADVTPVVHGEWLKDGEGEVYCSKCGKYTYDRHDEIKEFDGKTVIALCYPRFCGNCGADMRGEV